MHSSSANPALFFSGGVRGIPGAWVGFLMACSYQGLYTNLYRNTLYLTKSIYTPPGKSQIVKGSGKSQVLNPLAICDFPGGRRGSGPTLPLGGRG